MPKTESPYSPFFRRNLLSYFVGSRIVDIKRYYNDYTVKEYLEKYKIRDWDSIFQGAGRYLQIVSTKGILNIGISGRSWFNVRQACRNRDGTYCEDFLVASYSKKDKRSYYGTDVELFSLSLTSQRQKSNFTRLLGAKIIDFYLLEESSLLFKKDQFSDYRSDSGIRGFAFQLDVGVLMFYRGGFAERIVRKKGNKTSSVDSNPEVVLGVTAPYGNLILVKDETPIENGDFIKSHGLCVPGQLYRGLNIRSLEFGLKNSFILPEFGIDDESLINIENVISNSIIDPRTFSISRDTASFLQEFGRIDLKSQILFIRKLVNDLEKNNVSLTELVLGLDQGFNFRIVRPIDIVPVSNSLTAHMRHGDDFLKRLLNRLTSLNLSGPH